MALNFAQENEETEKLRRAVALVALEWTGFENMLGMMLDAALHSPHTNLGLYIYFAPDNSGTRLDILDEAVGVALKPVTGQIRDETTEFEDKLREIWPSFLQSLHRTRMLRNHIVHGGIILVQRRDGTRQPRITPAFLDYSRNERANRPGQLPGRSVTDVMATVKRIHDLAHQANLIYHALGERNRRKWPSFVRTVQQLEAYRRTFDGQTEGAPNPPKTKARPRPSRA